MKITYTLDDNIFDAGNISDLESKINEFLKEKNIIAEIDVCSDAVIVDYPECDDVDAEEDERIVINFCQNRRFDKARKVIIGLIKKAPANSDAYRLYAQIEMEDGNFDKAIETVKDALRINPKNLFAIILLGNLLSRDKGLISEGLLWYKRAYELYPESVLSVNNYACALLQSGVADIVEVEQLFRRAICLDSSYLNAYYALAGLLFEKGDLQGAFDTLQEGLRNGYSRAENPAPIVNVMTEMLVRLSWELAKRIDPAFADKKRVEVENEEGVAIEFVEDSELSVPVKMKLADVYGTEKHQLLFNPCKTGKYKTYYLVHELEKQLMRVESKRIGRSAMFGENDEGFKIFLEKTSPYVSDKFRSAASGENMRQVLHMLMRGMGGQLMNAPLDFFVFHRLFVKHIELRPVQVAALVDMAKESIASVISGVENGFPKNIVRVNRVLNAVTFIQYRNLAGIDLIDKLRIPEDELKLANLLYAECSEALTNFKAGDEWGVIQRVLEELRCNSFFKVIDEASAREEEARQKEATKQFQDRFSSGEDIALNMSVKMFMVSAIKELRNLPEEKVKRIAAEIAILGMKGIKPDQKSGYSVSSLDNRDMSGCQMLAYYYVSWKIGFPESVHKLGLPFDKEYLDALAMTEGGM